jgi:hypothetical protein
MIFFESRSGFPFISDPDVDLDFDAARFQKGI